MNAKHYMLIVLALVGTANAQWNPTVQRGLSVRGSGTLGELPIKSDGGSEDVNLDRYTAAVEYGVTDWLSLYAGGGAVNVDMPGFSDSTGAWLAGARIAHALADEWSIGGIVEATGWSADDSATIGCIDVDMELDATEVYLAGAVAWSRGPWTVYGGPYAMMVDGDATLTATCCKDTKRISSDIKEDESFGGFIGASFEAVANLSLAVEYRTIGNTVCLGIAKAF
jgi:opacity protein-like surface antigen